MWQNVRDNLFHDVHIMDIIFCALWLFGWFENALHGAKYDLQSLIVFYGVARAYILGSWAVNSVANSPAGQPPK